MEAPTVRNTYAIIISIGCYLLLLLQIEHRKVVDFRGTETRDEARGGNRKR